MVKWPFRRSSDETIDQPEYQVPAEIQDYYQAERRERTGVAWLMATGTLVVTILLAVGLFFGGRWIYRKVAGNNNQQAANTGNVEQATTENQPESAPQTSSTNTDQPSPTPPTPAPTPAPTPTPTPTPTPASPSPTPSSSTLAANNQTNIPNTGPGDVAAVTLAAAALGATGHYLVVVRRSSRSQGE